MTGGAYRRMKTMTAAHAKPGKDRRPGPAENTQKEGGEEAMKTVQQIMQVGNAQANIQNFRYMQEHYTYDQKVRHAKNVAVSFEEQCWARELNCHVSVGGLDSITLHYFLEECGHLCAHVSAVPPWSRRACRRSINKSPPRWKRAYPEKEWLGGHMALPQEEIDAISDPILRAEEQARLDKCATLPRMYFLKPLMPKTKVIEKFGWPVLSKEIAGKISLLQNPTEQNATVRHAILTGETGEYGGWQKDSRMKLSDKWLQKFGGADPAGAAKGYQAAPFKVSERCCYYLKEKPCDDWAKKAQQRAVPGAYGQRRRPPTKKPDDARMQLLWQVHDPQRPFCDFLPTGSFAAGH